jgi:hypothetical protein
MTDGCGPRGSISRRAIDAWPRLRTFNTVSLLTVAELRNLIRVHVNLLVSVTETARLPAGLDSDPEPDSTRT